MKKLALSLAIVSALGLVGCGDSETIKDVEKKVEENGPVVNIPGRVVFDPSNGVLSVPNDLLMSGTVDGTLNIPVSDPTDGGDPFVALNTLDGWSTSNPFVLDINFPEGISLDGNSVFNPASVRIFEAVAGGDFTDPDCADVDLGLACKVVAELKYTEDFITQKSGNSVAVIPLKPLKPKTNYLLVMTDNLLDDAGFPIAGSSTYELARQDITTHPLGSEAQLGLQAAVNSYERAVVSAGVEKDSIIYTASITTQSTVDTLGTHKSLLAAQVQAGQYPVIAVTDLGLNVADIIGSQIPPELVPLYSTANFIQGTISLPYYLGIPTPENPMAPVNDWWKSQCDSAAMLAGLAASNPGAIPEDPISESDGKCMAVSEAAGLPWPGLRDLGIDTDRHLTKYSPVPKPNMMDEIGVQMTTPDLAMVNAVRASMGLPAISEPEAGWPVVILQHGITSKKEDMLAITGIFSLYGLATAAINHPLHGDPNVFGGNPLLNAGSRGFDLTGNGQDDISASTVSATHYLNLASLVTARDNLRQSTADTLGLRLGLNFVVGNHIEGNPVKLDTSKVHFLGHSLGAITGINFMAMANSPLNPAIDPLFAVATNSQAMPGTMIANFLLESGAFGNIVKSQLTYAQSEEFQQYVAAVHQGDQPPTDEELAGYFVSFYDMLSPAEQGALNGLFDQFAFAAQTVIDSGDPLNYAPILAATQTPTHLIEVVGNGVDNLPDQVIPNAIAYPLGGTEGAIALLGLPGVSSTTQNPDTPISGAVRYLFGTHSSILSPAHQEGVSASPEMAARATQEMQSQVANFFSSGGHLISVQDEEIVK